MYEIKCPLQSTILGAVMLKCCIGTSEVSRLMCSTRLMGDGCFNNIVEKKPFHHHRHIYVLFLAIWASIGSLSCMKIATLGLNEIYVWFLLHTNKI